MKYAHVHNEPAGTTWTLIASPDGKAWTVIGQLFDQAAADLAVEALNEHQAIHQLRDELEERQP